MCSVITLRTMIGWTNMDHDDVEKKYFGQFTRACKKAGAKKSKKDSEGIPTLFSGSKKKPWYCQPWGLNKAALTVFDASLAKEGDTLHGKTLSAIVKKFKKYIPQEGVDYIVGDSEGTIVFPLENLSKVVRHFSLKTRNASPAQLAWREKFSQQMKDKSKNG